MNIIIDFLKNTKGFYFAIYFLFALIFLGHYFVAGQAVYGDGIEYYAWLHSIYFDKDINFQNEFAHIYNSTYNNNFPNIISKDMPVLSEIGRVGNFHMPGMAIFLLPFYFIADLMVIILNFLGFNFLRNGYSDIYQIFSGLGAVFYGVIGIFITETLLKRLFIKKYKNPLTFRFLAPGLVFASSTFYYLSIDVLNSHFATFFITALFYLFLFQKKYTNIKLIILGLLIGLATLIRVQDVILFIPLFIYFVFNFNNNLRLLLIQLTIVFLTFTITILPLLFAWIYLYGDILSHPYFVGFAQSKNLNLFGSLLDSTNGLFTKTPIMLFLLIFVPLAFKIFRKETIALVAFFIIQIYGIAQYGGWPAASYGARMYISSMFLFFLLAGIFYIKTNKKYVFLITLIFILLNFINIFNFMLFDKQASGGQSGLEENTKVKLERLLNKF